MAITVGYLRYIPYLLSSERTIPTNIDLMNHFILRNAIGLPTPYLAVSCGLCQYQLSHQTECLLVHLGVRLPSGKLT